MAKFSMIGVIELVYELLVYLGGLQTVRPLEEISIRKEFLPSSVWCFEHVVGVKLFNEPA